jgi:hypothetical protein
MSIIVEPPPDVEALHAGVIEDARARQRRHRGFGAWVSLAAAAIAMIGVTFVGGGSSHPSRAQPSAGRPPVTGAATSLTSCPTTGSRAYPPGIPQTARFATNDPAELSCVVIERAAEAWTTFGVTSPSRTESDHTNLVSATPDHTLALVWPHSDPVTFRCTSVGATRSDPGLGTWSCLAESPRKIRADAVIRFSWPAVAKTKCGPPIHVVRAFPGGYIWNAEVTGGGTCRGVLAFAEDLGVPRTRGGLIPGGRSVRYEQWSPTGSARYRPVRGGGIPRGTYRCTNTNPHMLSAILAIWACASQGGGRSAVRLSWTTQEPGG